MTILLWVHGYMDMDLLHVIMCPLLIDFILSFADFSGDARLIGSKCYIVIKSLIFSFDRLLNYIFDLVKFQYFL